MISEWEVARSKITYRSFQGQWSSSESIAYYHNCVGAVNSGKMQQVFVNMAE